MASCDTPTPFGLPVDPEVKITYAVLLARSGAMRSVSVSGVEGKCDTSRVSMSIVSTPSNST